MTGRDCWKSSPRCEGKVLADGNNCKVLEFWKILLLCFCLCVQTAMAFGVLAILGPERSQSPEIAKLLGSKVSEGFKRMVADIWAVSTCSWNQKMEMLGSLELFGCHREA